MAEVPVALPEGLAAADTGPQEMPAVAPRAAGAMATGSTSSPAALAFGALQGSVGFHLARASVTAYAAYEQAIGEPFGLSKVEFSLLMLLQANAALAPKRLARGLAVTAPKLSVLLDKLQARGLIQRQRNPADGRSQHIVLSPAGRQLAEATARAAPPMEQQLQEGRLSPAEHAMLIELLDKLARPAAG